VFTVGNRRVKVVTGSKTQSVNICDPRGVEGEYECIVRVRPPFTSEQELEKARFDSDRDLVAYLIRDYGGELQRPGRFADLTGGIRLDHDSLSEAPSPWEASARVAVEWAIDELVREFITYPYLHRCEHSIHCRLYQLLSGREELHGGASIGRRKTQLVHKEWPEFRPRPRKRGRGNFDLVILSPDRVQATTLDEFLQGRIRPSFAIEMGLDDDLEHLSSDVAKFRNSGIAGSYVVHLVREQVSDHFKSVEDTILNGGVRSAYAHHCRGGQVRYKLVNDSEISQRPLA
jgi:hypothetical protein